MTPRRPRRSPALLALLITLPILAACSDDEEVPDQLQVVADPTAATPIASPEPAHRPEGLVLGADTTGDISAMTTDPASATLAVATTDPARVLLYDLDTLDRSDPAPTVVDLPAAAEQLSVSDHTLLAPLPEADTLARIALPSGDLTTVAVKGGPTGAAVHDDATLVSVRDRRGIAVVRDDHVVDTITGGLNSADDITVADGHPVVLDRLRTAVFAVDVDESDTGEGLRAGQGATNVVADDHGRVFTADIRRGAVLAFSTDPLMLRQLYPAPGGPYALAYDSERDLLWVTLTAENQVVGYDVRGGEPEERHRYPTVRQPNSVTVDPKSSRVLVGSAAGEGIQVITP